MLKSQREEKVGKREPISTCKEIPRDVCPWLPEDEVRSGFGSRGWKECWFWKVGSSRRLKSGEALLRTGGTPGSSSLASRLFCNTGFRATAVGGIVQILLSPFSGS